jgi:murein DD-endopeptidase MepM/ murein hydrolase activator NlpD
MAAVSPKFRILLAGSALVVLAGCAQPIDFDLRSIGSGFDTSEAALAATNARPRADARGVISYPSYQVVVARRGDRVSDVASRIGLPADQLAAYNGIPADAVLRNGEIISLPVRIAETPGPATGGASTETLSITALADSALSRAEGNTATTNSAAVAPVRSAPATRTASGIQPGPEPTRHKVTRGETAYSVARLYGVTVRALAEWNGLGKGLEVREGQYLLIPTRESDNTPATATATATVSAPGAGSPTPTPPSAATALPEKITTATPPPAPDLGPATSTAQLALPVPGKIVRDYDKNKSAFILFSASPGTPVTAAANGTVKLVSKNSDGVGIMVIDHGNGLQSAYSFIEDVSVKKGDSVRRGQGIAKVAANEFSALQFMVFKGTRTVDPTPYLN